MKKIILSIILIFTQITIADVLNLTFNDSAIGSATLPGIKGKFKIVSESQNNNFLRVFSLNKNDSSQARILLKTPKNAPNNFILNADFRVATTATPAGKLLAICDWDSNKELFRLETTAGKLKLRATNYVNGKLKATEVCKYKSNSWIQITLIMNGEQGTCQISLTEKSNSTEIYSGSHTINKNLKSIFLASSIWPGQAKDGYAYDFDNISVKID